MGISSSNDFSMVSETPIGQGAFGKVFLVQNRNGEKFALKQIRVSNRQGKRKAMKEAKILSALHHPNVLGAHSFYEHSSWIPFKDKVIGIIMDYCNGGCLVELIQNSQELEEETILDVGFQVSNGLCYLHEKGIIHRDIKLENILIQRSGSKTIYKLSDLGLAVLVDVVDMETIEKHLCGTGPYMAPEILQRKQYSYASDIYAFGCVLVELMIQTRCWKVRSMKTSLERMDNYTLALRNLILSMIEKHAPHRPTSHAVRSTIIQQQKTLPTRRLMKQARSSEILTAFLLVGAVLLTAIVAMIFTSWPESL